MRTGQRRTLGLLFHDANMSGSTGRTWRLIGADGRPFASLRPGTLGGHRRTKVYGPLDCATALRAIAAGGYVSNRVFFADEASAMAAGYRPCARCLPDEYRAWKERRP